MKFYPPFPHGVRVSVAPYLYGFSLLSLDAMHFLAGYFRRNVFPPPSSVTELSCPEPEANSDYYKSCLICGREN